MADLFQRTLPVERRYFDIDKEFKYPGRINMLDIGITIDDFRDSHYYKTMKEYFMEKRIMISIIKVDRLIKRKKDGREVAIAFAGDFATGIPYKSDDIRYVVYARQYADTLIRWFIDKWREENPIVDKLFLVLNSDTVNGEKNSYIHPFIRNVFTKKGLRTTYRLLPEDNDSWSSDYRKRVEYFKSIFRRKLTKEIIHTDYKYSFKEGNGTYILTAKTLYKLWEEHDGTPWINREIKGLRPSDTYIYSIFTSNLLNALAEQVFYNEKIDYEILRRADI